MTNRPSVRCYRRPNATGGIAGAQAESVEEACHQMSPNVTIRKEAALSPRQSAALPYIVSEPTLTRGAQAAHITKRTLMRWMNEPAFRAELERVRRNIADLAYTELEGLTFKGVIRIAQLMDSDNEGIAHRASKTALSMSQSFREQRQLHQQLETLENAITIMRQQR